MLNCIDFWLVKNVTGRKLIGLRWWYYSDLNINSMVKEDSDGELSDLDQEYINKNTTKKVTKKRAKVVAGESSDSSDDDSNDS